MTEKKKTPTVDEITQAVLEAMTSGTNRLPLIEWEFRYRTARMVETVRIRTFTEQEAEARAVAMKYLEELASPNIRFVYVRLSCVATTAKWPELVTRFGGQPAAPRPIVPPAVDAGRGEAAAPPQAAAESTQKAANPAGFEDMDDGMSGPPVPADQVRGGRRIGA